MAVVRLLILVPLGILLGACAATVALYILAFNVPDLGVAFIVAIVSAWNALWATAFNADHPDELVRVVRRAGALATLVLLAPVALTAIIAEIARLRGALVHMVLAGALTILMPLSAAPPAASADQRPPTLMEGRALAALFFVGAAAGLIYWLIAGRRREKNPQASNDREAERKIVS